MVDMLSVTGLILLISVYHESIESQLHSLNMDTMNLLYELKSLYINKLWQGELTNEIVS